MKRYIKTLFIFSLSCLLLSCAIVKCPPDGRKVKFSKNPNHQYAVKGIEANIKATIDSIQKISGEASFKQNVMLVVQPLESKHVIIRDALDNAYNLAKSDPCNDNKMKEYNDLVTKALFEKDQTEEVKNEIVGQIKSHGISGGNLDAIKQIVNDYTQKSAFK